ncbi:hypothetical protein [Blastococcus xanthinilyticus]|uniref:Uncharacterized protein n=1 Tax=Blastococcus xanthinilyticus TaxID=1564164 RepID=A0A5S5CQ78_9ACTN|nr:hypothetical protein [Blastococcus xanthinilyticus]TYP82039.1 hypothetical protein BD833_12023 [Blastococcus xanthinilyticus]
MSVDVFRLLPAATLLRAVPDTALAATPAGSTVHVLNRPGGKPLCGRTPRKLAPVLADSAVPPPMRVCTLCCRRLPATVRVDLAGAGRPAREELAAVHEHAARQVAQDCVDRLAEIRSAAILDGTAGHPVELMVAVPAEPGPRPVRRSDRAQRRTGHIAGGQRMTLAQLINRFTPCGWGPGGRAFITDSPALGARVDVDGPRTAGGAR